MSFYISPFVRSRQTHKGIRNSFPDEQVPSIHVIATTQSIYMVITVLGGV